MKKLALLAGLLLASPALAHDFPPLRATLSGYQEVPSVSSFADAVFEARVVGDFADPAARVDWALTYAGLQADITQAHIHFAQRSVNGPIVVWLCGTTALPGPAGTAACPGARAGIVRGSFSGANILGSTAQQLATGDIMELVLAMRAGVAYVNIHTVVSPGGEIRGQLGIGSSSSNPASSHQH